MLRRFLRSAKGQAAVVETVLVMILLIAFFGGFSAYALAAHARAVVIGAAAAAGRDAAIACGQDLPGWQGDATAIAQADLQQGGLQLSTMGGGSAPGTWSVSFGGACSSGAAISATVSYSQLDLFPFVAPLLGQGQAAGWSFELSSTSVYPVE